MALPNGLQTGMTAKTVVGIISGDGIREDVEYGARCLAQAVVYQKNGKPVKNNEVDERIKEQLIGTMLAGSPKPEPAPEVEPIEAPEDLIEPIDQEAMKAAREIEAAQTQEQPVIMSTPPVPNQLYGQSQLESGNSIADNLGFDDVEAPKVDYEELLKEAEAKSVDNANLKTLVDALYRRFHIYLPYVNAMPQRSDISPTTGLVMNNITFGQAVQGFKAAQRTGASWNPQVMRTQIESARSSADQFMQMPVAPEQLVQTVTQENYGTPVNMPDPYSTREDNSNINRRYDSPHHTAQRSAHGKERDGLDPDELYAEPPINAQTPIIRDFVANQDSQKKLEEINRQRSATMHQAPVNFTDLI